MGLLAWAVVDQVLLYTALADGVFLDQQIAPYERPLFSNFQRQRLAEFQRLLAEDPAGFEQRMQFDPDLGWCSPKGERRGLTSFDSHGARMPPEPWPAGPQEGGQTLALVGCSFTLGSEVEDGETWSFKLDERRADWHVGNFGVPGFGTGQALLRYRRDVAPLHPDEVWLGFFPGSALRALTHFPPLTNHWKARTIYFKPRFDLGAGDGIVLHPSPAQTPADIVRLLTDSQAFFDAVGGSDAWVRRARPAYLPMRNHWSHFTTSTRLALSIHDRLGRSVTKQLARSDTPVFRLNHAIVSALRDEVESAGSRFRVLILPASWELNEFSEKGHGYWHAFVESLRAQGVEVLDPTAELVSAGVHRDPAFWMPEGHHSPQTHDILANAFNRGL